MLPQVKSRAPSPPGKRRGQVQVPDTTSRPSSPTLRAAAAGSSRSGRRRSPRAAPSRARRPGARARARSSSRRRCGRPGRRAGRGAGSRRRRSRRGSPRPRACCRTSRPCASSSRRERLQNQASPVSRVRRRASSSIQASISTRPSSASWTIAGGQVRIGHPSSFSSRLQRGQPLRAARGRSRRSGRRRRPPSNASARCSRVAGAARGDHGDGRPPRRPRASARGRSRSRVPSASIEVSRISPAPWRAAFTRPLHRAHAARLAGAVGDDLAALRVDRADDRLRRRTRPPAGEQPRLVERGAVHGDLVRPGAQERARVLELGERRRRR